MSTVSDFERANIRIQLLKFVMEELEPTAAEEEEKGFEQWAIDCAKEFEKYVLEKTWP